MGTTSNLNLPYPEKNDIANIPEDIKKLAEKTDEIVEYGDWTPDLSCLNGESPTVNFQYNVGSYVKIGKIVFIDFAIKGEITKLNDTNNYIYIKGLPFNPDLTKYNSQAISISQIYNFVNNTENVVAYIYTSSPSGIRLGSKYGQSACSYIISSATSSSSKYFMFQGSGWYVSES